MTNHGASQAPPPAVSVTESRKSFGGTTVLDVIFRGDHLHCEAEKSEMRKIWGAAGLAASR